MTEQEAPRSSPENEPAPPTPDEVAAELPTDFLRETLDKRLDGLENRDRVGTTQSRQRWQQIGWGLGVIVGLGVLGWIVLVAFGVISAPFSSRLLNGGNYIHLSSRDGEQIVILIKQDDIGEVRLIDPKTGQVQDISIGDTRASHAALSPLGDQIAYVSTDSSGSALYLAQTAGGISQIFSPSTLKAAAPNSFGQELVVVCEWSDLYWASNADQLTFFGCSEEDASALFIVPAQSGSTPELVPGTENLSGGEREAVWLGTDSLVITSQDQSSHSVLFIDLAQKEPKRLYGPVQ